MSQIDNAFIQAYATSEPSPASAATGSVARSGQVLPTGSPNPGPIPAPHISAHPAPQDSDNRARGPMAPEPIPAPHFQAAPSPMPNLAPAFEEPSTTSHLAPTGGASLAPPSTDAERRPLSTFASVEHSSPATFNPVFEVDAFQWPQIVMDLVGGHPQLLAPVVEQLLDAREAGRTLVGIAGTRPGVGCTTVQLCLANLLSQVGLQLAIVDSNFSHGDLAVQLGVKVDTGWEEVLMGRLPLAEGVVRSVDDQLALLPLGGACQRASELLSGIQTSITAGVLRYHYDMVLFDLGAAGQVPQCDLAKTILEHCRMDIGLIVADSAAGSRVSAKPINQLLELFGPTCHGLIGNHAA
ncbi:MAG: hypothetical protein MK171_01870 [Pirellulales bacterium]|nr:hypothetical protein [Pirellulales bacterium]